jgi:hypothetical protein
MLHNVFVQADFAPEHVQLFPGLEPASELYILH